MYKCVTNIQRFSLYTLAKFCVWKWKFSVWEPDMLFKQGYVKSP